MFSRQNQVQCYFCNSYLPLPKDPRNYRCPSCHCWNRYDVKGEILSSEPAMHEEALNARSFSKRASPSKDRLPTSYGKGPFCHTCETNQMLLVNLLSNYLPPPSSPEYEHRLEMLPKYRESLHTRYPPVCEQCLPAVEDEIRRKDVMARTQALGGWLKETKGKARQRRVSGTLQEREKVSKELLAWRIRGGLWGLTLVSFITGYLSAVLDYRPFRLLSRLQPILPILVLMSVLWTAWDPTYSSIRTAQLQGRDVRVQGKRTYNLLQMVAWISRLSTAVLLALQFHLDFLHLSQRPPSLQAKVYFLFSLLLEISVSISSFVTLRVQQPPTIRLITPQTHELGRSRSSTPLPSNDSYSRAGTPLDIPKLAEPDLFASLSLSSQPIVSKNAPVFGMPSLLSSVPPTSRSREDADKDEMDWSPTETNPAFSSLLSKNPKRTAEDEDDGSWLRPQRFFAPEKPTGLEQLFEKTQLVDDVPMRDATAESRSIGYTLRSIRAHLEGWWWIYAAVLVLVMGLTLKSRINSGSVHQVTFHSLSQEDGIAFDDPIRESGVFRHTSRSSRPVDDHAPQ